MRRHFVITIEGPEADVGSLRPAHLEDAVAEGLRIPFEDVTATGVPK